VTDALPCFIRSARVAELLGYAGPLAFLAARKRLEEDHAFPVPMPTCRNPMIWRRDLVEAWLAEQGRARHLPVPERPSGPNIHLIEEARRA